MKSILALFIIAGTILMAQEKFADIKGEIQQGNFKKAEKLIELKLNDDSISELDKLELKFELERMDRIRKDFRKTEQDVLDYVRKYYPDADGTTLEKYEQDGSLEYKIIDGEKLYFNRSQANLFRINKEAKAKKEEVDGVKKDGLDEFLEGYLPGVVKEIKETGENFVKPVKINLDYTITVDTDVVPDGEMIRCWMPFPREGHGRQQDIKLISANSDEYIIADNNNMQRTIYMEKPSIAGEKTVFNIKMEYTGRNEWYAIDPNKVGDYDKSSDKYQHYTAERAPHIIFTDEIKKLSAEIVGDETNPYLKAKKIFTWINNNIPWAGAREYSTIRNISQYCVTRGHGDCGIKTLTFMTLCRYNGIPTRWQSGWMLQPGQTNLHDWGQFYLEGYGWVPVDQSFGLVDSNNEDVAYFFLGGMDAYRLIANDDFSKPLFPAKIYPRSETVDFQRGELEWRGGNLYFDKWDYHMNVEYSE